MEKEEKDIRFVARFYRENRLDTTQAWQKLGIGKQRNNSILLYRLITIAAVTFLIAGFSWWWIYDNRQDWIVIASSAHAVKEVTLPDNSHITLAENSALQYDRLDTRTKKQERHFKWKSIFFSHTSRTMSFQGTDRTGKHTSTRYTIPSNGKCKSDFGNRRVWKSPFL